MNLAFIQLKSPYPQNNPKFFVPAAIETHTHQTLLVISSTWASEWMKIGDLSDSEHAVAFWVFQKMLTYWDFPR